MFKYTNNLIVKFVHLKDKTNNEVINVKLNTNCNRA